MNSRQAFRSRKRAHEPRVEIGVNSKIQNPNSSLHGAPSQNQRELFRVPLNFRVFLVAFLVTGHLAFGQGFATNTYTVSSEDFANPERGFYFQADSYASAPSSVPANLAG